MNFALTRKLIIFGLALPLAAVIGFVLATPQSRMTFLVVVAVTSVLLSPVLIKWYHPLLIFSWNASAKLAYEFHGEPNKKPEGKGGTDYYETYDLDDKVGKDQSNATFIAPTTGIHGWFWHNTTKEPVTLKLVSAGFYDWLTENRHDKFTTIDPMDPK